MGTPASESSYQRLLIEKIFPSNREELNSLFKGREYQDLSEEEVNRRREEAIARSVVLFNGVPLGEQGFTRWIWKPGQPSFRDILFQLKPFLSSNSAWRTWWSMEPADRWYSLTGVQEKN